MMDRSCFVLLLLNFGLLTTGLPYGGVKGSRWRFQQETTDVGLTDHQKEPKYETEEGTDLSYGSDGGKEVPSVSSYADEKVDVKNEAETNPDLSYAPKDIDLGYESGSDKGKPVSEYEPFNPVEKLDPNYAPDLPEQPKDTGSDYVPDKGTGSDYVPDKDLAPKDTGSDYVPDKGIGYGETGSDYVPDKDITYEGTSSDYVPDEGTGYEGTGSDYVPDKDIIPKDTGYDYVPDKGIAPEETGSDYVPDKAIPHEGSGSDYFPAEGKPREETGSDYIPDKETGPDYVPDKDIVPEGTGSDYVPEKDIVYEGKDPDYVPEKDIVYERKDPDYVPEKDIVYEGKDPDYVPDKDIVHEETGSDYVPDKSIPREEAGSEYVPDKDKPYEGTGSEYTPEKITPDYLPPKEISPVGKGSDYPPDEIIPHEVQGSNYNPKETLPDKYDNKIDIDYVPGQGIEELEQENVGGYDQAYKGSNKDAVAEYIPEQEEKGIETVKPLSWIEKLKRKWSEFGKDTKEVVDSVGRAFHSTVEGIEDHFSGLWLKFKKILSNFGYEIQRGAHYVFKVITTSIEEVKASALIEKLEQRLEQGNEIVDEFFQKVGQKMTHWAQQHNHENVDEGLYLETQQSKENNFLDIFQDKEIHSQVEKMVTGGVITQEEADLLFDIKQTKVEGSLDNSYTSSDQHQGSGSYSNIEGIDQLGESGSSSGGYGGKTDLASDLAPYDNQDAKPHHTTKKELETQNGYSQSGLKTINFPTKG